MFFACCPYLLLKSIVSGAVEGWHQLVLLGSGCNCATIMRPVTYVLVTHHAYQILPTVLQVHAFDFSLGMLTGAHDNTHVSHLVLAAFDIPSVSH